MRWLRMFSCWLRSVVDGSNDYLIDYSHSFLAADAERLRTAIRDIEYSIAMATLYGIDIPSGLMLELVDGRELLARYEAELARCNHAIVA